MIVSVPKETLPGEQRVALVPELVPKLTQASLDVLVQPGAGESAGFFDTEHADKGAHLEQEVLSQSDILLKVQPPTIVKIVRMREDSFLISFLQPYTNIAAIKSLAARKITAFSMELMPRITRAQPMDALSAMSTIAGYKAVLIAASRLTKFFPLLMTASGTITSARVFVIGAGVAGLQAIGTAKRLGAIVEAYDTRPAVMSGWTKVLLAGILAVLLAGLGWWGWKQWVAFSLARGLGSTAILTAVGVFFLVVVGLAILLKVIEKLTFPPLGYRNSALQVLASLVLVLVGWFSRHFQITDRYYICWGMVIGAGKVFP